MRVLAVTNMYPTPSMPASGVFVGEQVRGLRAIGVTVEVLFVDRVTKGMSAYFTMMRPVREALRSFAPDIVHVMYGGVMADQVMRKVNRVPKLVTFHGSDLLGENLSGTWRKLISHYGIFCSRRAAKLADGIVVVSERLKKALPSGLEPAKIRIIPCGIDVQRFQPLDRSHCRAKLGWKATSFHVLFPSRRNNTVKRPALALAAVAEVAARGVVPELHFLEGVPNEAVPLWMNASDALILTSAHEGSPTVVKEALACGLPVVSVDVGDVGEQLRGVEGCHLAASDPTDLASKLLAVKRTGNSVVAREKVQRLSLENIAIDLAAFYQQLVASSHHKHS